MLINAHPRFVSNGFETFVPIQEAELLHHQRLVEMSNNNINAWSIFRPVAPVTTDNWDQHIDDFGGNENFSVQTLYGGYFQDTPSQVQTTGSSKAPLYTATNQVQYPLHQRRAPTSHPIYRERAIEVDRIQRPSSMLGSNYSQWNLARGRGNSSNISNGQNQVKDFSYQSLDESSLLGFGATVSSFPQPTSSYSNGASKGADGLNNDTTSPCIAYSSYSPSNCTSSSTSFDADGSNDGLPRNQWWPSRAQAGIGQYQNPYGTFQSYDGLPKPQNQQQLFSNRWQTTCEPSSDWVAHTAIPNTISPKALTLNVSSTSLSSPKSTDALALSEMSALASVAEDPSDMSSHEFLSVTEPESKLETRRPRQILPDSQPNRRVPVVPSNDFAASKTSKKKSARAKYGSHHRAKSNSPYIDSPSPTRNVSRKTTSTPYRSSPSKSMEPSVASSIDMQEPRSKCGQLETTEQALHRRNSKDDFLVRSKLAGMSYKDIRRQGNFTEAESTLRGRFRTLTKHKNARVRKPEWDDNDIRLLKRAVCKLSQGSDPCPARVPWKKVAEYIADNGGSYHFGNATCRKRWDELQRSLIDTGGISSLSKS
ncbi:hypothetical protein B7494_g5954 [Chlorociboria aeruginascens]|nr:hypothetical protein B7494_g5954 [Chlorociboria aeruginascens]